MNPKVSPDFRNLFESAPGLYLVLDPDFVIVAASAAYLRATMTTREQVLGHGIFEIFPDNPGDPNADGVRNLRASLIRVRQHCASDPMPLQKYDIRKPASEGGAFEVRYWSPVNSPVFSGDGQLQYIIHRVEDVTDFIRLKQRGTEQEKLTDQLRTQTERMEAEIFDREHQLQEANRSRLESIGRLAGGVAHDFNNLLGVIVGCAELILGRVGGHPAVRQMAEQILHASERAASLTKQLLTYSLQQVLEPCILDLNSVVLKMESLLRRLIGEDVDFQLVLERDLQLVKADPGQIEQVIMNLVINARDAMPLGGRLLLRTANVSHDDPSLNLPPASPALLPYVLLSVSDSGTGIDEATRQRMFEPFFTTKDRSKGTGLGLSTVYGIVKQSGGHISVESEVGRGSTFSLFFPVTTETAIQPPQAQPVRPSSTSLKATVLLVEDQTDLRQVMEEMLRESGFRVLSAACPADAFAIASAHADGIQLLVSDAVLPGMNGRALADQLRQSRPQLKVLFVSGYTENVLSPSGTLESGIHFLHKPFRFETLRQKVRQIINEI